MLSSDHRYAKSPDKRDTSRRTEPFIGRRLLDDLGLDGCLHRAFVDKRFLMRRQFRHSDPEFSLRPARCLMEYVEYRNRLKRSNIELMDLHNCCLISRTRLTTYIRCHHGTFLTLSWPVNKYLQIVDDRIFRYDLVINRLRRLYPLCDDWLVPVGVIVGSGETFYSDYNHPILLITARRHVLLYVKEEPRWLSSDTDEEHGKLYIAADSVWTLVRDGLSRCDWCYTETGGAPYATVPDDALKECVAGKLTKGLIVNLQNKWKGHRWMINGCPGMLSDRIFRLRYRDAPIYILDHLKNTYADTFYLLGYVLKDSMDSAMDCELFVLIDDCSRIFIYSTETGKIRYVAETIDMFFRIGTRRFYLNFELYPQGKLRSWDEPTCYPNAITRHYRLLGNEYTKPLDT